MKKWLLSFFLLGSLLGSEPIEEKPFVIVIASYNNEKYVRANVLSALRQDYSNYRVIYINDCSTDRTFELVERLVKRERKEHLITLIDNTVRRKAFANYYYAIHDLVDDDEIVITLDGDDALAHGHVLSRLNRLYSRKDREIWLTYGQYQEMNSHNIGFCAPMPKKVVAHNAFRKHNHIPSHLRSFYGWLFKLIKEDDLMYNGDFYEMSWDMGMMLPMIEMSRDHFAFVPQVLYIYNDRNPISDHMISKTLQREIDLYIRSLPPYQPLKNRP